MNSKKSGYIQDVDRLIEETRIEQVLSHYNLPQPQSGTGEYRMQCVFNDSCAESQYGNLTVRLDDPANRIYCHTCEVRGNLLTLLHGLEHHRPPAGGRLRGSEFKDAVAKLREIAGESFDPGATQQPSPAAKPSPAPPPKEPGNTPLIRHEKEAARQLANLYEELVTDVSEMSPEAAQYVRRREWLTSELMEKWGVGWIPGNGRSLFRKSYLVYTHRDERNQVLSYSGRDLTFEEKWNKWLRDGRPEGKKPNKHRYVSGYRKGQELYGAQANRLEEEYVRESLERRGVVVVEGMNEVLRLETLGVAAVGIGSNKATDTQVQKLIRFAKHAGNNRILLLPDCDEEGEAGFKDLLWKLAEHGLAIRLGCSSKMNEGRFAGRQPEDFDAEDIKVIDANL